jgi:hypothetical protein
MYIPLWSRCRSFGKSSPSLASQWNSAIEQLKLLTAQVQDVTHVQSAHALFTRHVSFIYHAVAPCDLSQKIPAPIQGIVIVQLNDTINTVADNLVCATEVLRVRQ